MMTDCERAEQMVARWEHGSDEHRKWLRDMCIPEIEAELAVVRREARGQMREEAAQIAARAMDADADREDHALAQQASDIEDAIRALPIDPEKPEMTTITVDEDKLRELSEALKNNAEQDKIVWQQGRQDERDRWLKAAREPSDALIEAAKQASYTAVGGSYVIGNTAVRAVLRAFAEEMEKPE